MNDSDIRINFLNELPSFLKPRLRVFLSADLIGSTALKQAPILPFSLTSGSEPDLAPVWLSSISDFYFNFAQYLQAEWARLENEPPSAHKLPTGAPPELWKANGDELIYSKEVGSRREIVAFIKAWVSAIARYRQNLGKPGTLDLKSYGWTAGFPVFNSEVVFWRGQEPEDDKYEQDARLRNFYLIDKWYGQPNERDNLIRDFIGPSIDAGFRLSQIATARRMPISLDLAWLLATAQFARQADRNFVSLQVRYGGAVRLKGVLGDQEVPHFWIDLMHNDSLTNAEAELHSKEPNPSRDAIGHYCDLFYERHKNRIFRPFIFTDKEYGFLEFPENYIRVLEIWKTRYPQESDKYAVENPERPTNDVEAEGQTVAPADASKLVTDLRERVSGSDEVDATKGRGVER